MIELRLAQLAEAPLIAQVHRLLKQFRDVTGR